MKHRIAFLVLIIMGTVSHAQNISEIFFNEFLFSLNKTNIGVEYPEGRMGFGLQLHHAFFEEKRANLVFGIEYNRTNQYIDSLYESRNRQFVDLTYHFNNLSFPLGFRYSFGRITRIFIEAGGFADVLLYANRKGTKIAFVTDENDQLVRQESQIDEKAQLTSILGVYAALGLRIPVSKMELIIKPEYKYGINEYDTDIDDFSNRYFRLSIGLKIK